MITTQTFARTTLAFGGFVSLLASAATGAALYSLGHGDIRLQFDGSSLNQTLHLDPESIIDGAEAGNAPDGMDYEPFSVTTLVPEPTLPLPSGSEWEFVGTGAEQPIWYIFEAQEFDRPWLGLSTETLDPSAWSNFQLRLVNVDGPASGQFSLSDSGGPSSLRVLFATSDGIDTADRFEPILGSHAHFTWLFTTPGNYDVTLEASGLHDTAGLLSSTASYRFNVIPEPSAVVLIIPAAGVTAFRRRRILR